MSSNSHNDRPLPYGWVEQFDPSSGRPFWVNTQAHPPRSIWVHPYEDEEFLKEHPDIREKESSRSTHQSKGYAPPPGPPPTHQQGAGPSVPHKQEGSSPKKRGFLSKIKDKAIGTKEERDAAQRQMALMQEQRRQQRQQMMANRPMGYGGGGYGGGGYYQQQPMMMGGGRRGGGMGGMGGMALPLAGGLAGGFLLGEALDNDHGDYGGGDYGGGDDFGGGGDFGGGDF
ncbi:hypothetical protein CYLTODRAFT_423659 [Cylindrobasidium torrendii FP15055 ss-10]|uniref:WW domain-containing protein n=1 Tax=Cylindrobasidium torrendii FP15055 ss-10 TaxID=1314674 RepID=A0A0D7B7F3_9AGAR|nr:hypothetical protein CYLTODRAFT_423659 [Cylindrobasidium torrendii FP15055 ss-10]